MRRSLLSFALACILTMIPAIANAPVFATDISLPTAPKNSGSWNDYSVSEENKAWYTSGSKNVTLSNTEQFIYLCQMAELDTFEGWSVYIACDLDLAYWRGER